MTGEHRGAYIVQGMQAGPIEVSAARLLRLRPHCCDDVRGSLLAHIGVCACTYVYARMCMHVCVCTYVYARM